MGAHRRARRERQRRPSGVIDLTSIVWTVLIGLVVAAAVTAVASSRVLYTRQSTVGALRLGWFLPVVGVAVAAWIQVGAAGEPGEVDPLVIAFPLVGLIAGVGLVVIAARWLMRRVHRTGGVAADGAVPGLAADHLGRLRRRAAGSRHGHRPRTGRLLHHAGRLARRCHRCEGGQRRRRGDPGPARRPVRRRAPRDDHAGAGAVDPFDDRRRPDHRAGHRSRHLRRWRVLGSDVRVLGRASSWTHWQHRSTPTWPPSPWPDWASHRRPVSARRPSRPTRSSTPSTPCR